MVHHIWPPDMLVVISGTELAPPGVKIKFHVGYFEIWIPVKPCWKCLGDSEEGE